MFHLLYETQQEYAELTSFIFHDFMIPENSKTSLHRQKHVIARIRFGMMKQVPRRRLF